MRTFWLVALTITASVSCGGKSEDGGTGGTSGGGSSGSGGGGAGNGGSGAGGSGGTGLGGAPGGGGAPCAQLSQGYAETLAKAKACDPNIDFNECQQAVPDALACPCTTTFVNPGNDAAMKTLKELQAQWDLQKCGEGLMCPAIACEVPGLGTCEPDASTGSGACQDQFANGG